MSERSAHARGLKKRRSTPGAMITMAVRSEDALPSLFCAVNAL
jgi:hypothetical protein